MSKRFFSLHKHIRTHTHTPLLSLSTHQISTQLMSVQFFGLFLHTTQHLDGSHHETRPCLLFCFVWSDIHTVARLLGFATKRLPISSASPADTPGGNTASVPAPAPALVGPKSELGARGGGPSGAPKGRKQGNDVTPGQVSSLGAPTTCNSAKQNTRQTNGGE